MDNDLSHMRITIWVTFATLALVVLFATFPSIDLRFSALFFSPVEQPWSGREPFPEWLRIRCAKVRSLPPFWLS